MGPIVLLVDELGRPLQGAGVMTAKTIGEADDFADAVELRGRFNVTVSGTFDATVTLQRSYDNGAAWHDRAAWTAAADTVLEETEQGVLYRIGVKAGDYTSGDAAVRLGQ